MCCSNSYLIVSLVLLEKVPVNKVILYARITLKTLNHILLSLNKKPKPLISLISQDDTTEEIAFVMKESV